MGNFTTAIDFGSSKIAVAVGQKTASGIKIVSYNEAPTGGIRVGEIINDKKVCDALMGLIRKAESECGEAITSAVISVSDKFLKSKEVVAHSQRRDYDKFIDAGEILCLSAQQTDQTLSDEEIIFEAIPQKFDVDDQIGLKIDDVIGMKGAAIDGFFKIFYGKKSILDRRISIMNECNLKVEKAILSHCASARATLTKQEMENGVVLVDIGKGLTEISIVKDSIVRDMMTIPFAGESVTNDIKTVASITYDWAECLKKRYGSALEEYSPENKMLIMHGNDNVEEGKMELSLLSKIIEARLSEIFDAVSYFIKESGSEQKIPSGVVLTGGTAYMEHIKPLAKSLLGCRIRLSSPQGNVTMDSAVAASDTTASTAVGLIIEALDHKLSYAKSCKARIAPPVKPAEEKPEAPQPAPQPKPQPKPQHSNPLRRLTDLFDLTGKEPEAEPVSSQMSPEDIEIDKEREQKRKAEAEMEAQKKAEEERIRKENEAMKKAKQKAEKERHGVIPGFFGSLFEEQNNEA